MTGGCETGLRGEAAQAREKFVLTPEQRQAANKIVHCHNDNSSCPATAKYMDLNIGATNVTKKTWAGKQ